MNKTSLVLICVLVAVFALWRADMASAVDDTPPPGGYGRIVVYKFFDFDLDGMQDPAEPSVEGWEVRLYVHTAEGVQMVAQGMTDAQGMVTFDVPVGWYKVWEADGCGQPTTPPVNGWLDGGWWWVTYVGAGQTVEVRWGNPPCAVSCEPRTPGFWKNHPDAWPVDAITIGGVSYSKAEAIALLGTPEGGDKTYTLFRALVAAKLNVADGCSDTCLGDTIWAADAWMAENPVGSGVAAGGRASPWRDGEPLYLILDAYNNGLYAPCWGD